MPERPVTYHHQMLDDLKWWRDHDQITGQKVVELIEHTIATPEAGYGRPKRLHALPNLWSRRVDHTHRIHYLLDGDLRFLSCHGHELPQYIYDQLREAV